MSFPTNYRCRANHTAGCVTSGRYTLIRMCVCVCVCVYIYIYIYIYTVDICVRLLPAGALAVVGYGVVSMTFVRCV